MLHVGHRILLLHARTDSFRVFPELGLFVVADGMGGAAAGEVAATMAVERVCEAFADPDATWPTGWAAPGRSGRELLVSAIERANHGIHGASLQRREWRGMGTTIAALLACGSRAVVAHVGDSRVYRLRARRLSALTEDHSLFNHLVRAGRADPERPEEFEYRNIITRCLGADPTVEVEARWVEVTPGDTFLLCSDGLTGVVPVPELEAILVAGSDLDDAVEHLILRANELGGPDNITAVLVRVG